jgi:hypothetical protein
MAQAFFAVQMFPNEKRFVVKIEDEANIQHARDLLSGKESSRPHVMGRIRKQSADYNPGWSYHIDPPTIQFFDFAIEVCDATATYLEDHLDEACGPFLPGCVWCPWMSRIVEEVTG